MKKILPILLLLSTIYFLLSTPVLAAWQRDPEVTEVGRNAERARQLIFWLFTHPSLDDNPGTRQIWAVARNVVYFLFIVVLVAVGFGLMFFRERGFDLQRWIPKLIAALLYVTFSYLIVLGLIQIGDILTRFFIEKVGGCNLFNITFSGAGSRCVFPDDPNYKKVVMEMEKNYTEFIGYRETTPENNESANTALTLVRLTTFTYNFMSFMLIVRKVILWFFTIVSPFLGILMLFIVIRNTGWLWIGAFFQWLFYGPLMALFLAGLVRIWELGIPYSFDWSRRDKPEGQVFKTAINILIGGPAQTLTPTNSVNYIDTYAEYVIALIMLWTVILLPWLLLRCFREYCCHSVNKTLKSFGPAFWGVYDELKKWRKPPPSAPTGVGVAPTAAAKLELPYRKPKVVPRAVTREEIAEISKQETREILKALGLAVPSIRDIALADINMQRRQMLKQKLNALRNPAVLVSESERKKFTAIRHELRTRAARGDVVAQKVLAAAEGKKETMVAPIITPPKPPARVAAPAKKPGMPPTFVPSAPKVPKVTVEDYEEVKKMWVNNYRLAEVPVSEKIKTRKDWLQHDIKKITNAINLLSSVVPEMKKKGMDQVAEILPFLLLGGFTEQETITYLKAKLEAAKLVLEELERIEKVKEEVKEEKEELVEVPVKEKKEEEKALEAVKKLAQEIPKKERKETEREKISPTQIDKKKEG